MSSGSCAMKIRMARAFTKPVTTERETKRIKVPRRTPAATSEGPREHGSR